MCVFKTCIPTSLPLVIKSQFHKNFKEEQLLYSKVDQLLKLKKSIFNHHDWLVLRRVVTLL